MKENKYPSSSLPLNQLREQYESGRNPMAFIPYVEALLEAGSLSLALEICKDGLSRDPLSIRGRILLAKIMFSMGRYDNALEELGAVLQVAPDAFGANLLMARILTKKREYHDAMDIIRTLKNMNPSDRTLRELENFLNSQISSMETKGDFYERKKRPSTKPASLDERIDELLMQLRTFPGVNKFNFTKLPDEKEVKLAGKSSDLVILPKGSDPIRSLFAVVDGITKNKGVGELQHLVVNMDKASMLLFRVEDSLLQIETKSNVNLGKLRLRVEKLMVDSPAR